MPIQSRYRSQAPALSRAIRMLLMVMLRSGSKGRQGTCRDQAQGNRVITSPRWTRQKFHSQVQLFAALGSCQEVRGRCEAQRSELGPQPVLERDALEGGLVDGTGGTCRV